MEPRPEGRGDHQVGPDRLRATVASMEPRPEGRGDPLTYVTTVAFQNALQWSHGPKAVETHPPKASPPAIPTLQWSHGPKAVETPWPTVTLTPPWLLQWSHGPKAVET